MIPRHLSAKSEAWWPVDEAPPKQVNRAEDESTMEDQIPKHLDEDRDFYWPVPVESETDS